MPVTTYDPKYQPITAIDAMFEGEDKTLQWTISTAAGAVQDVTGWTFSFKLESSQGGTAVLTKSPTSASPTTGVVTLALAAADTTGLGILTTTTYWYELERANSGANAVLAYGEFVLQAR